MSESKKYLGKSICPFCGLELKMYELCYMKCKCGSWAKPGIYLLSAKPDVYTVDWSKSYRTDLIMEEEK